jgi:hypothetical protein
MVFSNLRVSIHKEDVNLRGNINRLMMNKDRNQNYLKMQLRIMSEYECRCG